MEDSATEITTNKDHLLEVAVDLYTSSNPKDPEAWVPGTMTRGATSPDSGPRRSFTRGTICKLAMRLQEEMVPKVGMFVIRVSRNDSESTGTRGSLPVA